MKRSDSSPTPDVGINRAIKEYGDLAAPYKSAFRSRFPMQHNAAVYSEPEGEVFTLPSQTVPDMSMSIKDMVYRHLHGKSVSTFGGATVAPDSMIPLGLERMSKIELAELGKANADFIATTRGKMISAKQARERAQFDALVSAEAAKKLAANAGVSAPSETV